jgi:hypothetical protein
MIGRSGGTRRWRARPRLVPLFLFLGGAAIAAWNVLPIEPGRYLDLKLGVVLNAPGQTLRREASGTYRDDRGWVFTTFPAHDGVPLEPSIAERLDSRGPIAVERRGSPYLGDVFPSPEADLLLVSESGRERALAVRYVGWDLVLLAWPAEPGAPVAPRLDDPEFFALSNGIAPLGAHWILWKGLCLTVAGLLVATVGSAFRRPAPRTGDAPPRTPDTP